LLATLLLAVTSHARLSFSNCAAGLTDGDREQQASSGAGGRNLVIFELQSPSCFLQGPDLLGRSFYRLLHVPRI